jgi:hypothetical protein
MYEPFPLTPFPPKRQYKREQKIKSSSSSSSSRKVQRKNIPFSRIIDRTKKKRKDKNL